MSGIYRATFVTEADLSADGSDFDGISSGEVGIFNVDTGAYLSANEAFLQVDFASDTTIADTTSAGAVNVEQSSVIVPRRFQIVQGRDVGNPWCSPIIQKEDVLRIDCTPKSSAAAATSSIDFTGASIAVGETYSIKFVITSIDFHYENFVNPNDSKNVSYVGQVLQYERTATSATLDTELAAMVVEFNAKDGFPFTASYTSGTDVLLFTCDNEFVSFETKYDFSGITTAPSVTTVTDTKHVVGFGDGRIVRGMEKQTQALFGYQNRIYLPQSPTLYSVASNDYDMISLTFDQGRKGHANPWLFTGENVVNIAIKDGTTHTNFDNAFGANIDGGAATIYSKYGAA